MPTSLRFIACGLYLFALACGGSEDERPDEPLEGARDTSVEDTAGAPDSLPGDVAPPDAADLEADPTVGAEDEDVDPEGAVRPGDGSGSGDALPPWTTGRVARDLLVRPPIPIVTEFRQGRAEDYDRWVIQFQGDGTLPGYQVEYIDRPLHECGSGDQIHPVGDAWLQVRLEPARGHTEAGQTTLSREIDTPALTRGLKVYRTCDFEAVLTLVLAVDNPKPFRAFHLTEPARVVVDVQH